MAMTKMYRDQHVELQALLSNLKSLDGGRAKQDAASLRKILVTLAGKLTVHLAMEDKSLYPALLSGKDPALKAKAQRFVAEMGGIKQEFTAYLGRYPSAETITRDSDAFVRETKQILAVLEKRINAEDADLYPAADALE